MFCCEQVEWREPAVAECLTRLFHPMRFRSSLTFICSSDDLSHLPVEVNQVLVFDMFY